jgi:hypothetical protein
VAFLGMTGASKRNDQSREAVIKLTEAVNTVANRLDDLHVDLRADRKETFSRLGEVEQRVAKLEARI